MGNRRKRKKPGRDEISVGGPHCRCTCLDPSGVKGVAQESVSPSDKTREPE